MPLHVKKNYTRELPSPLELYLLSGSLDIPPSHMESPTPTSMGLCSCQSCTDFFIFSVPWQPRPYSEQIVEPGQGLQEDIGPLIGEFIAASNEEVQGLVQVEVQVPKEATS